MPEKMDFMQELARQVEAEKTGKVSKIDSIDDYRPRRPAADVPDYEEPEITAPVKEEPEAPVNEETEPEIPSAVKEEPVFKVPEEYTMDDAYTDEDGRPDSYNEEQFTRVVKPKRHLNPLGIGLLALLALIILGIAGYILFFPKIKVENFTGEKIDKFTNWAKQNKMESSAVAKTEEYSLEYDKDIIIDQSLPEGKKIRPDTPITVTVSLGPDPSEEVSFITDISTMHIDEVVEWANENKLSKFKKTAQYSDTVPEGEIISYQVKNGTEAEFTRGTTLNVYYSKGPAPAGQVTMDNFTGKNYAEIETWARNKKVLLQRQDTYSDTVENNIIISTSKKQGETMKEGDTIVVVVSKGKGVHIPNLVGYTKEQLEAWTANRNNNVTVVTKSIYNEAPAGSVIAQNAAPGTVLNAGDVLELTISLYLPILETNSREWLGKDYLALKAWGDDVNSKGARIQAGQYGDYQWNICSDEYPTEGQIIDYGCLYGTSDLADGCGRPLTLDSRIAYTISTGGCSVNQLILTADNMKSLESIKAFCMSHSLTYSVDEYSTDLGEGVTVQIDYADSSYNQIIVNNKDGNFPYIIPKGAIINIHWNEPGQNVNTDVVLSTSDLYNLETIKSWCDYNGMACTFTPTEDSSIDNIEVTVTPVSPDGTDKSEVSYKTNDSVQVFVNKSKPVKVVYRTTPSTPTPEPTSASSQESTSTSTQTTDPTATAEPETTSESSPTPEP